MTDADADAATSVEDAPSGRPRTESVHVTDPSDAFQALGNEIRMGILETMLAHLDDREQSSRVSFSTLFEASTVDTTAGFAYHIDELVGLFLEKTDDGYALTHAGRKIARAIETGSYTHRMAQSAIRVDDPCPFCEQSALEASGADNVVTIACTDCERSVLRMDFPPTGFTAHGDGLPDAFDRHHRHRIALLGAGVCPECSGGVEAEVCVLTADASPGALDRPDALAEASQVAFACRECGYDLRCPVTLTLLEHPAVVSFYRDHDESVRECPIWNVGREWSETPLSRDPVAVRVAVTLEDETLECYVDETCDVVATRRGTDDGRAALTDVAESDSAAEVDVA